MCNLLQNHSFEVGLNGWITDNVSLESRAAFEGTQAAKLNTGISSIYQDVFLPGTGSGPLFLNFSILSFFAQVERPERGNLVVEVIWQNGSGNPIGTGLRLFIPSTLLTNNINWLTYVEVTDRPPASAVKARLQFSKGDMTLENDAIIIDHIILAPIEDINLVTNPGFQERLFDWNSINSGASGFQEYEGTNYAVINGGGAGTIFQDVPINSLPPNSSFLLSFAARMGVEGSDLLAKIEYRDAGGPLGTGLSLLIPASALNQEGWKTYAVAAETAAPAGATIARVSFTGTDPDLSVHVDKVILTMVKTPNLLINPSFEAGLTGWTSENVIATTSGDEYEGEQHARAGNSAYIFQDVNIGPNSGCCYLLTFGAQGIVETDALVEVIWLNAEGREIGLGTSLLIPEFALYRQDPGGGQSILIWSLFASVTEPAPPEAAAARVLFSVANNSTLEIDLVSFTSMKCPPIPPPPPQTRGVKYQDIIK